MKVTAIAARLRKTAIDMEILAAKDGNFDFPDEVVLPFIVSAFTDDAALKFSTESFAAHLSQGA